MGQSWAFVAPAIRRALFLSKLGEFFTTRTPHFLVKLLFVPPQANAYDPVKYEPSWATLPRIDTQLQEAFILTLSPELLDLIFKNIPDLLDILCLSFSCSMLWSIGYRHAGVAYLDTFAGDWVDTPIICVGDYVKDYPDGFLSEDVLEAMRAEHVSESDEDVSQLNLYSLAMGFERQNDQYKDAFSVPTAMEERVTKKLWEEHCVRCEEEQREVIPLHEWDYRSKLGWFNREKLSLSRNFPPGFRDEIYKLLKFANKIPNNLTWTLRNMSKKEYVTANRISQITKDFTKGGCYNDGPYIDGIGLGHVLLSQICWSSDPSKAMDDSLDDINLTRGRWAGDRFDITSQPVPSDEGWKDVSEDMVRIIEIIWDSEYGDSWEIPWL
ncbi:hypothetical protein K439DRAFT_1664000 [Ramaria rubella]|nr:hypothetical protein K439DRAFT_1664000 [Ramaria rubella]